MCYLKFWTVYCTVCCVLYYSRYSKRLNEIVRWPHAHKTFSNKFILILAEVWLWYLRQSYQWSGHSTAGESLKAIEKRREWQFVMESKRTERGRSSQLSLGCPLGEGVEGAWVKQVWQARSEPLTHIQSKTLLPKHTHTHSHALNSVCLVSQT